MISATARRADSTIASQVQYAHDSFGNLLSEALAPLGTSSKTTQYVWDTTGINRNRLQRIIYPSGRTFEFDYGNTADTSSLINRPIGIREVDPATGNPLGDVIAYDYSGSGRQVGKNWGKRCYHIGLQERRRKPAVTRKTHAALAQGLQQRLPEPLC